MKALEGRIALITGASRGIGAAVAKRFAGEGAHVILAARGRQGLEETDDAIRKACPGAAPTLAPLDLAKAPQIEALAAGIAGRYGRLDILVGNAAVLTDLTPMPHIAPEDWNKAMTINLTANWQLIRCFDALLRQSDAGRALFVTSGITRMEAAYWGPYAASKAGLEAMVNAYAAENRKTPLKINLIDPGVVRTRMRAQAFPGEDPLTLPSPDDITDLFVKMASPALTETGEIFFVNK